MSKIDIILSNIDALSQSCLKDTVPEDFEISLNKLQISASCNVFKTVLPDLFVPFLGFVI